MVCDEIIKALECCGCPYNRCLECPLDDMSKIKCFTELTANALALINHQKAEIERLQKHIQEGVDLAKQIPEMLGGKDD